MGINTLMDLAVRLALYAHHACISQLKSECPVWTALRITCCLPEESVSTLPATKDIFSLPIKDARLVRQIASKFILNQFCVI
jgi:hypothetical protein